MKQIAFVTAGAMALSVSAVLAADLPSRAAPVALAPLPVFAWTGFYAGVHAGYAWGESKTSIALGGAWDTQPAALREEFVRGGGGRLRPGGFAGGFQAGFNHQMGAWVAGLEADLSYADLRERTSYRLDAISAPGFSYAFGRRVDANWVATLRPRLGYAFDRTLLYVTGGLALANVEDRWNVASNGGALKALRSNDTRVGWTVGAGVEHAFAPNWTAKLEYLYTDLGSVKDDSVYLPGSTFTNPVYTETLKRELRFSTVRLGVNYRF